MVEETHEQGKSQGAKTFCQQFWIPLLTAAVIAIIVCGFYIGKFHNGDLSSNTADWGTFGDYIGGVLNPAFGFITILILLYTVGQQSRELKNSTEALRAQQTEMGQTREIAKKQLDHIQQQAEIDLKIKLCLQINDDLQKELIRPIKHGNITLNGIQHLEKETTLERLILNIKKKYSSRTEENDFETIILTDLMQPPYPGIDTSFLKIQVFKTKQQLDSLYAVILELSVLSKATSSHINYILKGILDIETVYTWAGIFDVNEVKTRLLSRRTLST